jgi:hypothetical protein
MRGSPANKRENGQKRRRQQAESYEKSGKKATKKVVAGAKKIQHQRQTQS